MSFPLIVVPSGETVPSILLSGQGGNPGGTLAGGRSKWKAPVAESTTPTNGPEVPKIVGPSKIIVRESVVPA